MVYWYEGYCKNCGRVIRGRILDDGTITVDTAEDDNGWFDKDERCCDPDPQIIVIIDVD